MWLTADPEVISASRSCFRKNKGLITANLEADLSLSNFLRQYKTTFIPKPPKMSIAKN